MAETLKKYRLKAAKYHRREKGALVRYEKGAVLELTKAELAAFGDMFVEVAVQKDEIAKPTIVSASKKEVDTQPPQPGTSGSASK